MSDSLWDEKRVARYVRMYGDPREKKGSQSILCRDATSLISGDSVLDVGCGIGHLIPWLRDSVLYLGLDYSRHMLDALTTYFPDKNVSQGDATEPFMLPLQYETVISISLVIHLPTLDNVRALLRNMWEACSDQMIFGVETEADKVITRPDGLTLRSISIDNVREILKEELGVDDSQITWIHQKHVYEQQIVITPSKENPMSIGTRLTNRTSLFKVVK